MSVSVDFRMTGVQVSLVQNEMSLKLGEEPFTMGG